MPLPTCTIDYGDGPTPTDGGVDVEPSATLTIQLVDLAIGVWSLTCVGTDETLDIDAINASIAINHTTKTATVTAPSTRGTALIFQTQIESGRSNGQVNKSYTDTFIVHTLTAAGGRVGAANEKSECGVFGWLEKFNRVLRSSTTYNVQKIAGAPDDLPVIQEAIDAAAAAGGGNIVLLDALYEIDASTLNLHGNNIVFESAAGLGFTTIRSKAGSNYLATVTATGCTGLQIRNLTIDANGPNRTACRYPTQALRLVNCVDTLVENVEVTHTRGQAIGDLDPDGNPLAVGLSGVGCLVAECTRLVITKSKALLCGIPGRLSDGFYNQGTSIILSDVVSELHQDTGIVFENASYSGCVGFRIIGGGNPCGGLGMSVSGNSDVRDNFFSDGEITGCIAPIEYGVVGSRLLTGNLVNSRFSDIDMDNPTAGFPSFLCYPNVITNPTHLAYAGRIKGLVLDNVNVWDSGPNNQGMYFAYVDDLRVTGCTINSSSTGIQLAGNSGTSTDACTKVVIDGVVMSLGDLAVFGITLGDVTGGGLAAGDDVLVMNTRIRGGAATAWAFYCFGTGTNIRIKSSNVFTGAALLDEGGVGSDSTTFPRTVEDGPLFRSTVPSLAATGKWPVGFQIFNKATQVAEDASHPHSWVVTTAGVPGSAVFTPWFRDARTAGLAGALDTSATFGLKSMSANTLAINIQRNTSSGIGFGTAGADGGLDNNVALSAGNIRLSASTRLDLGISSGAYPWTFTAGIFVRSNTRIIGTGIGEDASGFAARLSISACTATDDQIYLKPGGAAFPTTVLSGGMSFDGNRLTFCMGGIRYNVGVKLVDVTYSYSSETINAGLRSTKTITVTGAAVGDKVLVDMSAAGMDDGIVVAACWVSAADTVKVRLHNPTAGNITTTGASWKVSVIHT